MIVITGAAGFIGSCLVARFNEKGRDDLILVDHLDGGLNDHGEFGSKQANLKGKKFERERYGDKGDFLTWVKADQHDYAIDGLIHMGACSSTTLQDADYFEKNNFQYSCHLAEWTLRHDIRFIYASSAATYGDGSAGYKDDEATIRRCKPLNLYGQSKQKFDQWILDRGLQDRVVGLKFFNVFGPNEYHKGDMRSVVCKSFAKVLKERKTRLFKSYKEEYADGEQKRDFIYVKDAVDVVMYFVEHPEVNGIFNVGTGQARSWNDLANALFNALHQKPHIEYFDMPKKLQDKYQYFTQAEMTKLRNVGYAKGFTSLEDAIADYVPYLKDQKYW